MGVLDGKVAIVTGASRGISSGAARHPAIPPTARAARGGTVYGNSPSRPADDAGPVPIDAG